MIKISSGDEFEWWGGLIGWTIATVGLSIFPVVIVILMRKENGSLIERLKNLFVLQEIQEEQNTFKIMSDEIKQ